MPLAPPEASVKTTLVIAQFEMVKLTLPFVDVHLPSLTLQADDEVVEETDALLAAPPHAASKTTTNMKMPTR